MYIGCYLLSLDYYKIIILQQQVMVAIRVSVYYSETTIGYFIINFVWIIDEMWGSQFYVANK